MVHITNVVVEPVFRNISDCHISSCFLYNKYLVNCSGNLYNYVVHVVGLVLIKAALKVYCMTIVF